MFCLFCPGCKQIGAEETSETARDMHNDLERFFLNCRKGNYLIIQLYVVLTLPLAYDPHELKNQLLALLLHLFLPQVDR